MKLPRFAKNLLLTIFIRSCNALLILVLVGVLCAAIYQQFSGGGDPCPYCWLQRMAMTGLATAILMNLRFGISTKAYSITLFFAFTGGAAALRQVALHVCPTFPIFGKPVFGINLYSWAFIVLCCSALAIFVFLFFFNSSQEKPRRLSWLEKGAFGALLLITFVNAYLLFDQCGFKRCPDVVWPQTNK